MRAGIFVAGTDTDCGKTFVSRAILRAARARGWSAVGFKPVAAGAVEHDGVLRNDDALTLVGASGPGDYPYELINPYCLPTPVSPHLAAAAAGVSIELSRIHDAFDQLADRCDVLVAEGAGGWRVPLAPGLDVQGLALTLDLPVVLVVGLRLGCLNHAQISEEAIVNSGARLVGWVATQVDPSMSHVAGNLETLDRVLATRCLGWLPHAGVDRVVPRARPLDLSALLGVAN